MTGPAVVTPAPATARFPRAATVVPSTPRKAPRKALLDSLMPLIVDAGVPLVSYYALTAAGMSTFGALAASSVVPAVRTVRCAVRDRRLNALAALILAVNVVGLLLSAVAGDPRLMLAKDSGVSSTIGLIVLVSAARGKPLMTSCLKPWLTRGEAAKEAVWNRLSRDSGAFRRCETRFSLVWGAALLGECVVRIVGAYTLPVDTMVWLGTVIMAGAFALATVASGRLAAGPMVRMIADGTSRGEAVAR
ncbi:VC0807 family protein [Streptomyces sp. LN785]|uniref:VC0807 family protein n=1 Tax=Streptomyces sp. LN785 TaxID=3112983 RepID=UPI003717A65B